MLKKLMLFSSPLLLIFAAAACGGESDAQGPEISAHAEAPGEKCPAGGVHLVIDGEDYYLCNGAEGQEGDPGTSGESPTISTAQRAAGEGDNPCEGDALEVTVSYPDADPVIDYVCQYYDPVVEVLGEYFEERIANRAERALIACYCSWDNWGYDSLEECAEEETGGSYADSRFMTWCLDSAYTVYDRPAPDDFHHSLQCELDEEAAVLACGDIFHEGDACDSEDFDAYDDCVDQAREDAQECYPDIQENEELIEWYQDFQEFLFRYGCYGS